jgi:hypothetical protein
LETGIQGRPEWSSSWREESGSLFEAKNVAIKEDVSLKAEVAEGLEFEKRLGVALGATFFVRTDVGVRLGVDENAPMTVLA